MRFVSFTSIIFTLAQIAKADDSIVGGNVASPGQFPHQISLRQNGNHICGGSIISPTHILTAAHCISTTNPSSYMIVTGTNSVYGGQVHRVKCVQVHPGFSMLNLKNDVAVLTLAAPIAYSNIQHAISLPSLDYANGSNRAIVSGWGKTSVNSGVSSVLKWLEVRMMTASECRQWHGNTDHTQICTIKARGEGACQGDSGGPLIFGGTVVGIVSWGIPCALGQPDVFTSVYYFKNYIQQAQQQC